MPTVEAGSGPLQQLAAAHASGAPIPWKRVYRLPDYVFFSHETHVTEARRSACETCHGPVAEMDVMQRVRDISMAACVDCHQQQQAPARCDTCHDPR
jgi:hypothetical protein